MFFSRGFTKRQVQTVWTIQSFIPSNPSLQQDIANGPITNAQNQQYLYFSSSDIESLAGYTLRISATVTNFLGNSGTNYTTIEFSQTKKLQIFDLQDVYTFNPLVNNTLYPRLRIPYCSSEDKNNQ